MPYLGAVSQHENPCLSVNKDFDNFKKNVSRIGSLLQSYFKGEADLRKTLSEISNGGNTFPLDRLSKDLQKLRRDMNQDPDTPFNKALSSGSFRAVEPIVKGAHAEITVAATQPKQLAVGVTLLSCADCHDYLQKQTKIQTRGTHGYSFPGWKGPSGEAALRNPMPPPNKATQRAILKPRDSVSSMV